MQLFILCFEIVGTISFALSGAMTAIRKNMDIFGVCVLGLTTAVGGGVVRDVILGITPPTTFCDPRYVLIAIAVSMAAFFALKRGMLATNHRFYEIAMLLSDSAGLGIFTVYGVRVAIEAGHSDNTFLVMFVAVLTGVGGGIMRDIFSGGIPYIFSKQIYACAALAGAGVCVLTWTSLSQNTSMILGFATIIAIRLLSAKYHLSLPKAEVAN